jgi:hypothetical protein
MRFALWFGIAAFLISGSLFNAFAHDAEGVLGLAFIVSLAAAFYGAHLQHQHEHVIDNPQGKIYNLSKQIAFHRIKDILLAHRVGTDSWSFSQLDAETGRLTASLTFTETMSAFGPTSQLPNQPRRLTINALVTPATPYAPLQSMVQLQWTVSSSVNRDSCDTIIHQLSRAIDSNLAASPLITRSTSGPNGGSTGLITG